MDSTFPFVILPKISIRPDKIVLYNQFVRKIAAEKKERVIVDPETKKVLADMGIVSTALPISNAHSFELSKKAQGRIKEKVTWLYHLAKSQTIVTHNNKVLYNFKMNFITLTLPSLQKHKTSEIIKECLNQFFTECNSRFNMKNYVWRLEYQKNGNAHFHIATDTFIEYWQCRSIWNRCINKLGYVNDYIATSSQLTLQEYLIKNTAGPDTDFKKLTERYSYGVSTSWSNPNTADVRCVTNAKNISFYIAKYITKKGNDKINPVVAEREELVSNMRLWFCSRSLSKVDKISEFVEHLPNSIVNIMNELKEVKMFIFDYCEVLYFNVKDQSNKFKVSFRELLNQYASDVGYFGKSLSIQ